MSPPVSAVTLQNVERVHVPFLHKLLIPLLRVRTEALFIILVPCVSVSIQL